MLKRLLLALGFMVVLATAVALLFLLAPGAAAVLPDQSGHPGEANGPRKVDLGSLPVETPPPHATPVAAPSGLPVTPEEYGRLKREAEGRGSATGGPIDVPP